MCIRTMYNFQGEKNWSPTRIRFNFWDTKNTFQPKVEQNIKKLFEILFRLPLPIQKCTHLMKHCILFVSSRLLLYVIPDNSSN